MDKNLIDKYRNPKSGMFSFPDDVVKIIKKLETLEARLAELQTERVDLILQRDIERDRAKEAEEKLEIEERNGCDAEGKISDLQYENNILKNCLRDIYPILENCRTGRYKSIKDLIDRILKGNVL